MRREYFGILLTLGALLACKRMAKEMLKEESPPAQTAAPAPAAPDVAANAATAPTQPAAAAAAPTAVASAAPAGAPFDGKYALDGIGQIPSNCTVPKVVLTAVTRPVFDSGKFPWNFAKQVFVANPQFKHDPALKSDASMRVQGFEQMATRAIALVAECKSADTCMQVAAAYKIVVPTSKPEVVCGKLPTLGDMIDNMPFPPDEPIKERLPPKDNVIQQCVRLAACEARQEGKLTGDPAIECQRRPSSFQLRCSFKESCADVLSCVGQSAQSAAAANGTVRVP